MVFIGKEVRFFQANGFYGTRSPGRNGGETFRILSYVGSLPESESHGIVEFVSKFRNGFISIKGYLGAFFGALVQGEGFRKVEGKFPIGRKTGDCSVE